MIYIKIPLDEEESITIHKNEELLYQINRKRKYYLGFKITGEFFDKEKKIAVVTNSFQLVKILFQDLENKIQVMSSRWLFYSKFKVGNNEVKIVDNPLYFIYPKFYSKIYWDNRFIANVSLQKVGFESITLKIDFKANNDREVVYYPTLIYAMTCININV